MPNKTHGLAHIPEYKTWCNMRKRCKEVDTYLQKGITVCHRWTGRQGFENFLQDVGYRPNDFLTLERIDNDKGYYPGNCTWADRRSQAKNRSKFNVKIEYKGQIYLLCDLALLHGISQKLLRTRLYQLMPLEKALEPWNHRSKKRGLKKLD